MAGIAFLFPGQGAQHLGMGTKLVEEFPAAASLFATAKDVLGYDLLELCANGPAEKLDATNISQPALYVASLAALEKLRSQLPDVVLGCESAAGLSLGEYTALVFAGAMSFEDGLRVVQARGEAMQAAAEATPSGMVSALLLSPEDVEAVRDEAREAGSIEIANYLCPGNTVLSGDQAACEKAVELIEAKGGRPIPLAVAGAFHTDIMKPADEKLAAALADIEIKSPEIPIVSNVDAEAHSDPDEIREILVKQVLCPVRWEDSIRKMLADGSSEFYEVGPGKVLTGLMKRIARKTSITAVNDS